MIRWLGCLVALVLCAAIWLGAQATPTSRLGWDQAAPSLAEAQGFTYKVYVDAGATGTLLTAVTCAGVTSPFQCSGAFPALSAGVHSLQITAGNVNNGVPQESLKSNTLSLVFRALAAPTNLRLILG